MSAQTQDLQTRWISAIKKAVKGEPLVESSGRKVEESLNIEDDGNICYNCLESLCCSDN